MDLKIPGRVTQKYLDSLTPKQREIVLEIKRERLRQSRLKAVKAYQKTHKDKVNEYHRERRRKDKEEMIIETAKRLLEERGEQLT